jgi:hypothetical protein
MNLMPTGILLASLFWRVGFCNSYFNIFIRSYKPWYLRARVWRSLFGVTAVRESASLFRDLISTLARRVSGGNRDISRLRCDCWSTASETGFEMFRIFPCWRVLEQEINEQSSGSLQRVHCRTFVAFLTCGDWKVLGLRLSVAPCMFLSACHESAAESLSITTVLWQIPSYVKNWTAAVDNLRNAYTQTYLCYCPHPEHKALNTISMSEKCCEEELRPSSLRLRWLKKKKCLCVPCDPVIRYICNQWKIVKIPQLLRYVYIL